MLKTLEGVRVVDFGIAAAGPSCSKLLAEYGAEVIALEPVTGATTRWMTTYYDFWSNGKKSMPLNIKDPAGKEAMLRIIKGADVFLSNYRAKALVHNGLTYEELKKINPRIIYAFLMGWGPKGPLKDAPAYDVTAFWARGGLLRDMAEKGSICVSPQGVADEAVGEVLASGICAALYHREKTGEGCEINTSIYAEACYLNAFQNVNAQFGEEYQKTRTAPREALANTYRCKDGEWIIMFDNQFDRHFWKLLEAVGRKDLVGDPRWKSIDDTRLDKAPELVKILDEAFAKMTSDEAVEALSAIDIAVQKCQGSVDCVNDPQALENNYFFDWVFSDGPYAGKAVKLPASPLSFNGENNASDFQRAPKLGEHTVEILKGVGYTDAEIQAMVDKGVTVVC